MREKKRDKIDDASEISFWCFFLTETAGLALGLEQAEDVVNADWCGRIYVSVVIREIFFVSSFGSMIENQYFDMDSFSLWNEWIIPICFLLLRSQKTTGFKEINIAYLGP